MLKGKTYKKIKKFFNFVAKIGAEDPAMLVDPNLLKNMDYTTVDAT